MQERIIRKKTGLIGVNFQELWRYRELLFFLGWRDVQVAYKQMSLGIVWAFIKPFLTMIVFTVIFGTIAKLPSSGVPYPVLTFAGLLPWQLFSTTLASVSGSVVGSSSIITKVYFPRLILPASSLIVGFVDFLIASAVFTVLMIWYGVLPTPAIVLLPLFLLLTLCASLGFGLWLSALNVEYRDVRFIVPFLLQLGMYISPVAYASNVIPEKWRLIYSLNPMVGAIDGFRWTLLGEKFTPNWTGIIISSMVLIAFFIGGILYFKRMEKYFADII